MMQSDDARSVTAHHEAGHAVAAYVLGRAFTRVSIRPDGETLGRCSFRPPGDWFRPDERIDGLTRRRIEERIMISLAGPEAEALYSGRYDGDAAQEDVERAFQHACFVTTGESEAWAYLEWLRLRTLNLMNRDGFWASVEELARELLRHEEVSYPRARWTIERVIGPVLDEPRPGAWAAAHRPELALEAVRRARG
jgi:hypothetical protein